jgi:hypothetical protein
VPEQAQSPSAYAEEHLGNPFYSMKTLPIFGVVDFQDSWTRVVRERIA